MAEYLISGGTPLRGRVEVSGAKNGALPILFATLLIRGETVLYHVPDIGDIRLATEILSRMGATVTRAGRNTLRVDTAGAEVNRIPLSLCAKIRASSYLIGACLARFGRVPELPTGGCNFGTRPLDCHYAVLGAMGAVGEDALTAPAGLVPTRFAFPFVSVGATVNAVLAALAAPGVTHLSGCAREGHVTDFLRFLVAAGAGIEGVGTGDLTITGGRTLTAVSYVIAPDEVEAGTYLCCAAAVGGDVEVAGVEPQALSPLTDVLVRMGCRIREEANTLRLIRRTPLSAAAVETAPAPGFPTDLHPPLAAVMCCAGGKSRIRECVFRERFRYTEELRKMGADLVREGDTLHIRPAPLHSAEVTATDLRGGAALLIAALAAPGKTVLGNRELLERGYESLPAKLRAIGARVDQV